MSKIAKIVSGGQTGADRAALDEAKALGVPIGGWVPKGGWAEDLPEPPGLLALYPELQETPRAGTTQRTTWNVRDSDVTLIFVGEESEEGSESPGTRQTVEDAILYDKPYIRIGTLMEVDPVLWQLEDLPDDLTVNVAGHRESEFPGMYTAVRTFLHDLILKANA